MVVESSGTQTATVGTEHTLASPSTAKTRVLLVDVAALTGAETVELRVKGAVLSGGTVSLIQLTTFGARTDSHTQAPPVLLPQGGTFTLKQISGTGRAFPWSIATLD